MGTLREIFLDAFSFAEAYAAVYFALSILVPLLGTGAALAGKGGKTDKDGRLYANVFVLVAAVQFVVAMVVGVVAIAFLERTAWDVPLYLLLAPWLWFVLSVMGLRRVFPLSELATWRSVVDVAQFFAVCAGIVWLFSMFRGWGIIFFGGLAQLLVVLVLGAFLLRVLFRRAFSRSE
jgi:hypothetical protein